MLKQPTPDVVGNWPRRDDGERLELFGCQGHQCGCSMSGSHGLWLHLWLRHDPPTIERRTRDADVAHLTQSRFLSLFPHDENHTTSSALLLPPKPVSVPEGIWSTRLESELTDAEYARRLDELDRLLNDPDVPMEPTKVWSLLAEIVQQDRGSARDAVPGSRQQSESR
jgi:hypothetical protein